MASEDLYSQAGAEDSGAQYRTLTRSHETHCQSALEKKGQCSRMATGLILGTTCKIFPGGFQKQVPWSSHKEMLAVTYCDALLTTCLENMSYIFLTHSYPSPHFHILQFPLTSPSDNPSLLRGPIIGLCIEITFPLYSALPSLNPLSQLCMNVGAVGLMSYILI